MRTIEQTAKFRRDYKRELKGRYGGVLEKELHYVLGMLRMTSLWIDAAAIIRSREAAIAGQKALVTAIFIRI